MEVDIEMVVDE
jgi:hypothetical protein